MRAGPCIVAITSAIAVLAASGQNIPATGNPEPPQTETGFLFDSLEISKALQPDPNAGLIKIDLVVTDEQGKCITGLNKSDLTLLDNGQPREIVTFQALQGASPSPDSRTVIILVIDEIDTQPEFVGSIEKSAQKFLLQNHGNLAQPVLLYRISREGLFASEFPSYDGNALARQIPERNEPRTIWRTQDIASAPWDPYGSDTDSRQIVTLSGSSSPSRSTSDARWHDLPRSLVALGSIAIEERRNQGRKLLFWLGSPWPVIPSHWEHLFETVTELSSRLREARIAIWFGDFWRPPDQDAFPYKTFLGGATSEEKSSTEKVALQVLAVQSGGGELIGEGDAAEQISQHASQANTFYSVTFDPPRTESLDDYHDLRVTVGKPGLTAYTRTGYYNEPSYYDQTRNDIERVNVVQLHKFIGESEHMSDSEGSRRLKQMELTERLSSLQLANWLAALKGRRTREALTALADQSAFLDPPADESMEQAPPNLKEQHEIIQRTVGYVSRMVPVLPNLITDRSTTLYSEPPRIRDQTWKDVSGDQSLDSVSTTKAAVHVSRGKEVVQEASTSINQRTYRARRSEEKRTLQTEGTFGAVLASVLVTVAKPDGKLMWARWEKGDKNPLAVFRYTIPAKTTIFRVGFCCMAIDGMRQDFETYAPTYGEIAVDPITGAIMRLTIRAGLSWRLPLQHSDIMIEYGPVVLGVKSYICPIRSVEISRHRSVVELAEFGEKFKIYAPFETILNDVKYDNYHLFQSTSRVLPGFSFPQDAK